MRRYRRNNKARVHQWYLRCRENGTHSSVNGKNLEWYYANRERAKLLHRRWSRKKAHHVKTYGENYRLKHAARLKTQRASAVSKARRRQWESNKRSKSVNFRLAGNLRARIRMAMKHGDRCESSVKLLGCSIHRLKVWLESLFKPGMTWDNYGPTGWHIDHKRPCASFNLRLKKDRAGCFHYTNLQPLWATENIKKGRTFDQQPIKDFA